MSSTTIPKVVPAQLSFLSIYNPALGTSDETFHNQVVFYFSKTAKARLKADGKSKQQLEATLREEQHEKLRQVGLAQGMVGFARSFSNGEAVDSVDTQKSRIVLHEIEYGWWILASIDLTQLPAATTSPKSGAKNGSEPAVEYSSREVSPPALLIHQLVRAYAVFLLHHGTTFESLYAKFKREKFCNILDTYWSKFANNWDVLLHGSPAVDIYGGLKLAAGGELGMGVGEEEWGSSERDVLEDFARRTEGLADVMVSRFGQPTASQFAKSSKDSKAQTDEIDPDPWIGSGRSVNAPDGVVFSGIGTVSRRSLRDISQWIESIYSLGEYAYGVRDNPATGWRKRRRKNPKPTADRFTSEALKMHTHGRQSPGLDSGPGIAPPIPPPIVKAVESSLDKASNAVDAADSHDKSSQQPTPEPMLASLGDTETWMKYLTLGYGTTWGGRKTPDPDQPQKQAPAARNEPSPEPMRFIEPAPDVDRSEEKRKIQLQQENDGYFLVGLKGDMEDADLDDDNDEGNWNNRIPLRTIHVELTKNAPPITPTGFDDEEDTPAQEREIDFGSSHTRNLTRLRPVVYVHRPFIYTFLFHHRTPSLSMASFYRDIHTFFSPLHRSLDRNTSPDRVAARLSAASHPFTTTSSSAGSGPNTQPIYDLVYDPCTLTVHSSIPNIPDPGSLIAEGLSSTSQLSGWSRVEALSVHSQILAAVADTRRSLSEIERTCKTSRGWWVVWMRLPPSKTEVPEDDTVSADFNAEELREAFLVRRARDATQASVKSSGGRFSSGMWGLGMGKGVQSQRMGGAAAGWGPKGLAEGIGIDARRYVEELLSLNR